MKKELSVRDIESQVAVELPERELLALVNVTVFNVLNHNTVTIRVPVDVAAAVCAALLATLVFQDCRVG